MSTLSICLLRGFRVCWGREPLSGLHHPREQSLLAYLLLHRDAPQSRRHVAFLFWPDSTETQAHTNLRNLLFKIRKGLPEPDRFIALSQSTLQWRLEAPYTLDVATFEAAATRARTVEEMAQALELYGGELLPGFYDEWIEPLRERLRQQAVELGERLVRQLEGERQWRAAIGHANRLLELDPLNEGLYRTLMRLHAADDDRAGALAVYHTCVRRLRAELDVEPSAETQAAYSGLLATDTVQAVSGAAALPPLVGRQPEWAHLIDAWRAASRGKPHLLVIAGEAGIGKSRLAEEFLGWARRQGADAAVAHCYAAEGALAYAPVTAWLRAPSIQVRLARLDAAWLSELARLLPELQTGALPAEQTDGLVGGAQRQRLFDALVRAVTARGEPLLLLLDDLQWCDGDTLEWLHYLLRVDPAARLLVVATMRTEDVAPGHPLTTVLTSLRRSKQISEIKLARLNAADTAQLAAHITHYTLSERQQNRLHRETEGNPLFVMEMVRAGLFEAPDHEPWAAFDAPLRSLPPTVQAVLAARLAQLSPAAHQLAGLAAVIGREFSYAMLAAASDRAEDELVQNIDELWQRGIVREQDMTHYDFSHDKLREVVYAGLSAARRRWTHRRVALALETLHPHAPDELCGQLATHFDRGGDPARAVCYYQKAALAAQRVYAHADAIGYDRRALALLAASTPEPDPALAANLYEHLGDTLHFTGEYEASHAALQRAIETTPESSPLDRARLLRKVGNTWRERYQYDSAIRCYTESMQCLEQAPVERTTAWWQLWIQSAVESNVVYYWQGRVAESDELHRRLLPAIKEHGSPGQRAAYYNAAAMTEFRRMRSVASLEIVALANATLTAQIEAGNEPAIPAAHFGVGFMVLWSGSPERALEPMLTALHMAERSGDVSLQARCLTYLAVAHRQCRDVERTAYFAASARAVATAARMPEYVANAMSNQAWLAYQAGDFDRTQALALASLALWDGLPTGHASAPFKWLALWPLLAAALKCARYGAAIDAAQRLLDPGLQRLPDALLDRLSQAVESWSQGAATPARDLLAQAVARACEFRCL